MEEGKRRHQPLGCLLGSHHHTHKEVHHNEACQALEQAVWVLVGWVLAEALVGVELAPEWVVEAQAHRMANHTCHCSSSYLSHNQSRHRKTARIGGTMCRTPVLLSMHQQGDLWDILRQRIRKKLNRLPPHQQPDGGIRPNCMVAFHNGLFLLV